MGVQSVFRRFLSFIRPHGYGDEEGTFVICLDIGLFSLGKVSDLINCAEFKFLDIDLDLST